uniref:Integrase catalytic domain-containing protein n=1 Tax=Strigamia maritima TaxID=126957 RepID=T1IQ93_STRMM
MSTKIVDKVNEVTCRFHHPDKIISDNRPEFISTINKQFCAKRYITAKHTSTYHPQANQTERANRDIKMMLTIYTDVHSQRPCFLNKFAYVQRTSKLEATGYTPLFLNTGRTVPLPFDPQIVKHDGNRLDPNNPELMNLVWKQTHILSDAEKGITSGFATKRDGPWEIIKWVEDQTEGTDTPLEIPSWMETPFPHQIGSNIPIETEANPSMSGEAEPMDVDTELSQKTTVTLSRNQKRRRRKASKQQEEPVE